MDKEDIKLDETYEPLFVKDVSDHAGDRIDYQYWNTLWQEAIAQGNYNAQTLLLLVRKLVQGIWDEENGLATIASPTLQGGVGDYSDGTAAGAIQYLWDKMQLLFPIGENGGAYEISYDSEENESVGAAIDELRATTNLIPVYHADLQRRESVDAHPISAITNLQETLDAIVAGAASAFPHNTLPSRDTADAHPIEAITGLRALLDRQVTGADVNVTNSAAETITLQEALVNIYALLQLATGVPSILHNAMQSRGAANSHPVSAITNLQGILDSKVPRATLDNYQTKLMYGTAAPAPGQYPEGTIYLRIYE